MKENRGGPGLGGQWEGHHKTVVSRGGRLGLAIPDLPKGMTGTLLLVASLAVLVIGLNRQVYAVCVKT